VMPEAGSLRVDLVELSGMEPPQLRLTIWLECSSGSAIERVATHPVMVEYFNHLLDVVICAQHSSWHEIYQRSDEVQCLLHVLVTYTVLRLSHGAADTFLGIHNLQRHSQWLIVIPSADIFV
jgi:hypothetical protein